MISKSDTLVALVPVAFPVDMSPAMALDREHNHTTARFHRRLFHS